MRAHSRLQRVGQQARVGCGRHTHKALISGKGPRVFVVLPVGSLEADTAYLERHAAGVQELAEWGARLLVVVIGTPSRRRRRRSP